MSQEATHTSFQPAATQLVIKAANKARLESRSLHDGPGLTDGIKSLISNTPPFIQPKLKIGAPNDKYEQEADRVAEQVMRKPEAGSVHTQQSPPQIQRLCPECEDELQRQPEEDKEGLIQPKSATSGAAAINSQTTSVIQSLKGTGQPLASGVRNFFEPRFNKNFSQVRIHTNGQANQAARSVHARAFTLGRDIVFSSGEFSPHTHSGGHLLAHELTHVVQQHLQQGGQRIQRAPPWEYVEQRRELRPQAIPAGLNYELQDHALIAHTTSNSDITQIADLMAVLGLYAGTIVDRAALIAQLTSARAGHTDGQRVSIDVTPHLPAGVRSFLTNMETYYAQWRSHVASRGSFDDIFEQEPDDTPERRQRVREWYTGAPTSAGEFGAVCHQFAMMAISGAAGGRPGQGATAVSQIDDDAVVASYSSSIAGTGPFRRVPRRQVRVGDIAVFRARRDRPGMPASRIIHSGIVIRVRRRGQQVELLEKTNPDRPMATRNVRQVLSRYSRERAVVYYLTPTLQGMPFTSQPELGQDPPTEPYTSLPDTIGNEHEHVLFRVNTNVLVAHQDQNLFRVLAMQPAPVAATIHGYASIEGRPAWNLNLSAHRAVTVKSALARHMTQGTRFAAIAHGATRHFGTYQENRRAGIELELPPTPSPEPEGEQQAPPQGAGPRRIPLPHEIPYSVLFPPEEQAGPRVSPEAWSPLNPQAPTTPNYLRELSRVITGSIHRRDIAGLGGRIASEFGMEEDAVRQRLDEAIIDGGEAGLKALLRALIIAVAGQPVSPPSSPYGPNLPEVSTPGRRVFTTPIISW